MIDFNRESDFDGDSDFSWVNNFDKDGEFIRENDFDKDGDFTSYSCFHRDSDFTSYSDFTYYVILLVLVVLMKWEKCLSWQGHKRGKKDYRSKIIIVARP